MADEKKPSFFRAQWDGLKAKALYDIAKYVAGAAIVSYFGPAALHQPITRAAYLFAVLIGLYLMAGAFLFRRKVQPYDPRLASAMLRIDAEAILQLYKELEFDYRERARLPLKASSWPDYGEPWDYVQVSLCLLARMTTALIMKAGVFWSHMEYKEDLKLFPSMGIRSCIR